MRAFARTDIGKSRPINEDSFYLPGHGEDFCAVADGMGGHNAGEVASAIAVKVFAGEMRRSEGDVGVCMRRAVEAANREIYRASLEKRGQSGMGTTFTGLCIRDGLAHIAHVGDSRAYLVRNRAILRVTTDHTLVEEMVIKGMITPQEARVHPRRNIVTRALGTAEQVEIDILALDAQAGDLFLLCSDGLSGSLQEREILDACMSEGALDERLSGMIALALEKGGHDNITALLATCEEDDG